MLATLTGDVDLTKLLAQQPGVDVTIKDFGLQTALHCAAMAAAAECCRCLLAVLADDVKRTLLTGKDATGRVPFHCSIVSQDIATVSYLAEQCSSTLSSAERMEICRCSWQYFFTGERPKPKILLRILECGGPFGDQEIADLFVRCASIGSLDCTRLLHEWLSNTKCYSPQHIVTIMEMPSSYQRVSALGIAALNGHLSVLRELIKLGASSTGIVQLSSGMSVSIASLITLPKKRIN
jgi:ankyrin repeat protein